MYGRAFRVRAQRSSSSPTDARTRRSHRGGRSCRGVVDQHRNGAATSNAGVAVSSGSVFVTTDADTVRNAQSAEIVRIHDGLAREQNEASMCQAADSRLSGRAEAAPLPRRFGVSRVQSESDLFVCVGNCGGRVHGRTRAEVAFVAGLPQ